MPDDGQSIVRLPRGQATLMAVVTIEGLGTQVRSIVWARRVRSRAKWCASVEARCTARGAVTDTMLMPVCTFEQYTSLAYIGPMIFIETPVFSRVLHSLLSDEEYRELQVYLLEKPDVGPVIKGSGGIRKLRWRAQRQGKRGGVRVIYYWQVSASRIFMLYLYPKNVQENLTHDQLATLRRIAERIGDG